MISDKEVGELWRAGHYDGLPHRHPDAVVPKLIRKLVQERAERKNLTEIEASVEFGIEDYELAPNKAQTNRHPI